MSENVERLDRGLYKVDISTNGSENLQKSNVLPDNLI